MPRGLELIVAQATAPGTGASMAAVAGNSLVVRDARRAIHMLAAWQRRQAAGFTRIVSPLLHDAVVGYQMTGGAGVVLDVGMMSAPMALTAQDTMTVTGSGSATAGDIEQSCWLNYYEDLAGANAQLISFSDLDRRSTGMIYAPTNTLALGTAGGYSGEELITAEQDQLRANQMYALIGYTISGGDCAAVRWRSIDTSNLGVGGPGAQLIGGLQTTDFFYQLSVRTGMPCIPVFNAANKSTWFIDGVTDENGTDVTVISHMMLLR